MYRIKHDRKFDKSLRKLIKNGLKQKYIDEIYVVIELLASGKRLPIEYLDHKLQGEFKDYRECHIQGDLLLVYRIIKNELVLVLINIGTHSELFK
jgi:mRNA interferase YafQ